MPFLIASLVFLTLPIALVWLLSKISKKINFTWAIGFKVVLCLVFGLFGMLGHIINPEMSTEYIPEIFRFPLFWVYSTGVLELVFVVLLWTRFQYQAGLVIIVYLAMVLPFNYYSWTLAESAINYIDDPNYMWIRAGVQVVLMVYAYYGTRETSVAMKAG